MVNRYLSRSWSYVIQRPDGWNNNTKGIWKAPNEHASVSSKNPQHTKELYRSAYSTKILIFKSSIQRLHLLNLVFCSSHLLFWYYNFCTKPYPEIEFHQSCHAGLMLTTCERRPEKNCDALSIDISRTVTFQF